MTGKGAVIITGASGGIGQALCHRFRADGYFVLGTDLRPGKGADEWFEMDLDRLGKDPAYRQGALVAILGGIGARPLCALVNNAALQIVKPVEALEPEDWLRTLSVNLLGPFLLIQGLLGRLEASSGAVVNIASIHAAQTLPGFTAYAASKAALEGMTRSLAVELGGRIRVNAIAPAAVDTPMLRAGFKGRGDRFALLADAHPARRIAQPEEIARVASFLVSESAAFITGAVFPVDGGIRSRLHNP